MKRNLLFLVAFMLTAGVSFGQISFSEDFESYNVGDYLGNASADWTTWSGTTGGAEDAQIVNDNSASGNNAIHFVGTGQGGPQDVVLPFGQKYTDGRFTFSMNFFVEAGAGGYFNLQGEETIGITWASNVWFQPSGVLEVSDDSGIVISTPYAQGEWQSIEYDINLTANSWNISVNGNCVGSFSNGSNFVASLDLFPLGGDSFWVDDVTFSHDPMATIPAIDAAVGQVDLRNAGLTGQEKFVSGTVLNSGTDLITSYDVTFTGGGASETLNVTGAALAPGNTASFSFTEAFIIEEGAQDVSVSLSNVNGGNDENGCNDVWGSLVTGYTPADGKVVLVEEATGTWCPWCPRGAVFLDLMESEYHGYIAGVAVHNGDPMTVTEYDQAIGGTPGFGGYPSMILERQEVIDPAAIEASFLSRLTQPAVATLSNKATYDAATRELTVTVDAVFNSTANGHSLNVIMTESGVTGTTNDYAQANAYAGGGNGEMGGYELLPTPVPAAQMVYDHVGRALLGGYTGMEGSLPASVAAGETHSFTFSYTIPTEYDVDKMSIIGVLMDANALADNASVTTIEEAIANDVPELLPSSAANVFPNPASELVNVSLDLDAAKEVTAFLYNANGQLVQTKAFGTLNGMNTLEISTANLPAGMYQLNLLLNNNQAIVKRVILAK